MVVANSMLNGNGRRVICKFDLAIAVLVATVVAAVVAAVGSCWISGCGRGWAQNAGGSQNGYDSIFYITDVSFQVRQLSV